MNRKAITTGILTVGMIVLWNGWLLIDWRSSHPPISESWQAPPQDIDVSVTTSTEPKLWKDIKKTAVSETIDGGFEPLFDESVAALEGTRVELPGVGFILTSGIRENEDGKKEVAEFLLLPGDGGVAWCCGLSAIPYAELSVLVQCPNAPFPRSSADPKSSTVFVSVEGTLRLMKENRYNAFYTLEDASVEFIDAWEVMPPNVKNLCLDQPMVP
ncbi:MAG: hypothetical protein AAFX06_23480 [Planctomycetota bacterium]